MLLRWREGGGGVQAFYKLAAKEYQYIEGQAVWVPYSVDIGIPTATPLHLKHTMLVVSTVNQVLLDQPVFVAPDSSLPAIGFSAMHVLHHGSRSFSMLL